jgi:hypothetical protein
MKPPRVCNLLCNPEPRHQLIRSLDSPLTDLYDTEGDGGYPGIFFKARPVVGGHFAFLALERACGGQAYAGLSFLEEDVQKETGNGRLDGEL